MDSRLRGNDISSPPRRRYNSLTYTNDLPETAAAIGRAAGAGPGEQANARTDERKPEGIFLGAGAPLSVAPRRPVRPFPLAELPNRDPPPPEHHPTHPFDGPDV